MEQTGRCRTYLLIKMEQTGRCKTYLPMKMEDRVFRNVGI